MNGSVNIHNDVVDWDVDEFHEEADEAHDREAYSRCHGDLLKLCGTQVH